MTTTTQHISPNPARDFANAILAETNNGLELIEILRDIADGTDENATTNDRIAANTVLLDRGLGKCPKQSPATNPAPAPDSEPDAKEPKADNTSDSPRLVTQIDQSLHDSFGPPPSAHTEPALSLPKGHSRAQPALVPRHGGGNPESYDTSDSPEQNTPDSFNPFPIQATIQRHILTITDNGLTLLASLAEIARAHDDPKACPEQRRRIKTSHRQRAARILIDRLAGTDLLPAHSAVCPECRRKWSTDHGSHTHNETHPKKTPGRRMSKVDPEALAKARAEIQRMKDEGILTPIPNSKKIDISGYLPPDDFDLSPYAKEEAAKFWANIELTLERQKQWPEIEERRRKKLEQIYPSHSEDDKPPDQ